MFPSEYSNAALLEGPIPARSSGEVSRAGMRMKTATDIWTKYRLELVDPKKRPMGPPKAASTSNIPLFPPTGRSRSQMAETSSSPPPSSITPSASLPSVGPSHSPGPARGARLVNKDFQQQLKGVLSSENGLASPSEDKFKDGESSGQSRGWITHTPNRAEDSPGLPPRPKADENGVGGNSPLLDPVSISDSASSSMESIPSLLSETPLGLSVDGDESGAASELSHVEKKARQRNHILKEIISTEETYVRMLRYLIHGYVDVFVSSGIMSPELVASQKVFSSLRVLSKFHNKLLSELRVVQEGWGDGSNARIGDLLCGLLPFMKLYVEYVNSYPACLEEMNSLTRNKKANAVIKGCKTGEGDVIGFHGFQSLLVQPIQRVPRYEMLLEALKRNTPQEHIDYADISKAAEGTKELSEFINEMKRKEESDRRVGMISSRLQGAQKNVMMRESVFDPDAPAFKELKGTKKRQHQWKQKSWKTPAWCFLCNKMCVENGKFKGLQCKNCPSTAHKACSFRVPPTCGMVAEESLLKHDRVLVTEVTGVSYCQVLTTDAHVKAKQKNEKMVDECSMFIFNDSIVCVEPSSDGSYDLLCMIKFYSRSTCRFAYLSNPHAEAKAFSVSPARETEVHHRFIFPDPDKKKETVEKLETIMADFKKSHEEAEQRRANRMRARFGGNKT